MVHVDTNNTPQFHDYLLKSMTEGLLVLDQQGFVVSANEAAAALLGRDLSALIGQHHHLFWPEEMPPPEEVASGEAHHGEAKLYAANGYIIPVTISVSPIANTNDSHKLVSITSIASVERLNDALSHAQKLAGIGTLTASVAHELNSPISIITSTCNNLLHEIERVGVEVDQLLYYIKMIEQSAWRCARIVGVLRNYTVEDTLQMAVTDLNMVIEDAVTLVQHQFQGDFNVNVELDLQQDLKSIVCDHNRLTQVLINLLTNARDAMQPNGGTIKIKSWSTPGALAESSPIEGSTPGMQFGFSVRDTGHGIAPEIMDQIFNPFFTTKPNGKGTGLGLYIARRIVKQHNGRLRAENNADRGATFTVLIPRKQAALVDDQLSMAFGR